MEAEAEAGAPRPGMENSALGPSPVSSGPVFLTLPPLGSRAQALPSADVTF